MIGAAKGMAVRDIAGAGRSRSGEAAASVPGKPGLAAPDASDPMAPADTRKAAATRRPTMTEVARIAGVLQSSVSLVLNQMTGAGAFAAIFP